MVYVFCAFYKEAQPLIEYYDLKKCDDYSPYDSFACDNITLIITGVGRSRVASAVGFIFGKNSPSKADFAINIGSCAGHDIGKCFVINSVHDVSSGRDFYPDMIFHSSISEGKIITSDTPLKTIEANDLCLYDMEASSFYESSSLYLAPSRIALIKCVSDMGSDFGVSAAKVYDVINSNIELIAEYISNVIKGTTLTVNHDMSESERLLSIYAKELHASEYMRIELKSIINYCLLSRIDFEKLISEFLPVVDRREGKRVLERLYEKFI